MKYFVEFLNQIFTLVGLFIAWVVLEGSAKSVVGWMILVSTVLYVGSLTLRSKD